MSFTTGRVSFCRFRVIGDAPATADEAALSILQEHQFVESSIIGPDQVDSGFITGQHLFDTQFSYDKNAYENLLLFALRIDTHKVPGPIKQAYRKLNEQAAASTSVTGVVSRAEKNTAADEAARQIGAELSAGKFRRSQLVPIIWDLKKKQLFCGALGATAIEQLVRLLHESFAVELDYQSAGVAAGTLLDAKGRRRDYEDLRPSRFTNPPPTATTRADDPGDLTIPSVPWVAWATDLKDFLGNEFFIWLWWMIERRDGRIEPTAADGRDGDGELFVAIDKVLDMDCAWDAGGKQTLRGHAPTRLLEAGDALSTGKWPRKARLMLSDGECQWELTLQADRMAVSAAVLPELEEVKTPREIIEQRLKLIVRLGDCIDQLYATFLAVRTGGKWPSQRKEIRQWIGERHSELSRSAAAQPEPTVLPENVEEVVAV